MVLVYLRLAPHHAPHVLELHNCRGSVGVLCCQDSLYGKWLVGFCQGLVLLVWLLDMFHRLRVLEGFAGFWARV